MLLLFKLLLGLEAVSSDRFWPLTGDSAAAIAAALLCFGEVVRREAEVCASRCREFT